MNLSEYELLSKEDIFKMYEKECIERKIIEELKYEYESKAEEFERERDNAYDEISGLMEEIETLKEALDQG